MQRIYLDYAASTPVDPRVLRAMRPYFGKKFGNPGSLHSFGQEAIKAVDESRETIAKAIGRPSADGFEEIIFTGSATEANNLALRGVMRSNTRQATSDKRPSRIIVSSIEHESVLETARDLEKDGVEVVYLPVSREGFVDLGALKKSLNERTVLVSVMYANNEVGTVQNIPEIAEILRNFRKQKADSGWRIAGHEPSAISHLPLLHADAAQAFQFLDCDVDMLGVDPVRNREGSSRYSQRHATCPRGEYRDSQRASVSNGVDLMTLSAHKIYGPKGVGALYVRQETRNKKQEKRRGAFSLSHVAGLLSPITTGGGQEFGLRSGTENVPGIVGFAKAAELLFSSSQEHWNKQVGELRDYFWRGLKKVCPEAELNGAQIADSGGRIAGHKPSAISHLPNILNVYFPRHESQFLLTKLDMAGVAASSGSACRSRAVESSHVLEAMGYSRERAKRSIRFSFGRPTTKQELDTALKIVKNII